MSATRWARGLGAYLRSLLQILFVLVFAFSPVFQTPPVSAAALTQEGEPTPGLTVTPVTEEPTPTAEIIPTDELLPAPTEEPTPSEPAPEGEPTLTPEPTPTAEPSPQAFDLAPLIEPLSGETALVWIAYNDCVHASGQPDTNITTFRCDQASSGNPLVNQADGNTTGATVAVAVSGSPARSTSNGSTPGSGDATSVFPPSIVSMTGVINYSSGQSTTLTISGLSPARRYTFAASANRADSGYTDRRSTFSIADFAAADNTSSVGDGVTTTATSTTFSTGNNSANGYIARWENIHPGTDGDFTVTVSYAEGGTAYGPSVFLLAEYERTDPYIEVTAGLDEFIAPIGGMSAAQTYSVFGANLTGDLNITAPANFEISANGSSYSSSLNLTPADGAINATIYVRFGSAEDGTIDDVITHSSDGAEDVTLPVSGTASQYYTLNVDSTAGGSVSRNPDQDSYPAGVTVTLTASASSGHVFTGWVGDLGGTANPATIVMDGDKTVAASFVAATCTEDASYLPEADTYIGASNATTNYGSSTTIYAQGGSSSQRQAVLMSWDLTDIPSYAVVVSADLKLYVRSSDNQSARAFNLYALNRDWAESTATYNTPWTEPGASSIDADRSDVNLWGMAGGDFSSSGVKTLPLNAAGIAAVQGWVANPASNHGFTIQNYADTTADNVGFASKEYTTGTSNRPALVLSYCVPNVPTIFIGGSLDPFTAPAGGTSYPQDYTVSAQYLEDGLVITAPEYFEVSVSQSSGFGGSVTLTPDEEGTIADTTIYVRFMGGTDDPVTGSLIHTSAGAETVSLPVNGQVAPYHTLSINTIGVGEVQLNPPGGSYLEDTVVTLLPVAGPGFIFNGWSGDDADDIDASGGVYTIEMDEGRAITAEFVVAACTSVSLAPVADTYIRSSQNTRNYGGAPTVQVSQFTTAPQGMLLRWELPGEIPTDAQIASASLSFNVTDQSAYAFSLYSLRRTWVEGTNNDATGSGVSWNYAGAGADSWETAGAADTGIDRYDTNLWDATTTTFGRTGAVNIPLNANGLAVLKGWVANPSSNYGLTIQNYTGSGSEGDYWIVTSREGSAAQAAHLNFTYCTPATGPAIVANDGLDDFIADIGVDSPAQRYWVAASNLSQPLTIVASSSFRVSLEENEGYSQSVSIDPDENGTIPSTWVYVRFHLDVPGTTTGSLTHESAGALPVTLTLNGTATPHHSLTVTSTAGGSVTPLSGSYPVGTVVTLIPTAESGYSFSGWGGPDSGDVQNTAGGYTIALTHDRVLRAHFVPAECSTASLDAAADNYMSANETTYNNGGNTSIHVDNTTGTARRGALMRWDLSSIPAGAVISEANLRVNVTDASPQIFNMYAMRRDWVEGTSSRAASTNSSNWATYDGANAWGEPGAASATADRYDVNLWEAGTTSFSTTGAKTVAFNAVGRSAIQGWLANAANNFGVTIQNYSGSTENAVFFDSREAETAANRPKLNLTYCTSLTDTSITASGTVSPFTASIGTVSTAQHYTVSASNLDDDELVITAPTYFQVSTSGAGGFGRSLSLPVSDGTLAATDIYVRFAAPSVAGTYGGFLTHVSEGAAVITLAVSGTAANLPPSLALIGPANDAEEVAIPVNLSATVTDPEGQPLNVTFFGREKDAIGGGEDFTLVVVPDTQNEAQYNEAMLTAQMEWIVNHKEAQNIAFVTFVGDIVNTGSSAAQYDTALRNINLLKTGGLKFSVAPGNHDTDIGTTFLYADYFGLSYYDGYEYDVDEGGWFAGYYDAYNTYSLFSAAGMDFILINLDYDPGTAVLNWADELLTTYAGRRAIVEQHNILNYNDAWDTANGQATYTALADHANLFLILCGHNHTTNDGAAYRLETRTGMQPVHIVMADYQDMSNGNGWLRLLRFSPADDKIYMTTYSPYLDTDGAYPESAFIRTDPDQKDLDYAMEGVAPFVQIGLPVNVLSGATAGVLWSGLNEEREYEWYARASDGENTATSATWSFTTAATVANAPPVIAGPDPVLVSMSEDGEPDAFMLTLTASDPNVGDTLTWSILTPAVSGVAGASGTGSSKAITYVPNANYFGEDSFAVQVSDGNGGTDSVTVNVTIASVNDIPVATPQTVSTALNTPIAITLSGSDVETSALTYEIVSNPLFGDLSGTAPSLTYTPDTDFGGEDSFTFRVSDGEDESASATVTIVVNDGNPPVLPSRFYGEIHYVVGAPVAGTLLQAYVAGHGAPIAEAAIGEFGDDLVYSIEAPIDGGSLDGCVEDETIIFKIAGRVVALGICREGGDEEMHIHPPQPTITGTYSVQVGHAVTFNSSADDWGDDEETFAWDMDDDGAYDDRTGQTPSWTWATTGSKPVGLKVTDGQGGEGYAQVTVVVTANLPPAITTINNQAWPELVELAIDVEAGDIDTPLEFSLIGATYGATLSETGAFSWTPTEAQGPDDFTFTVRVCDSLDECAEEAFTISVEEVNVAPVLVPIGNKAIARNGTFSIDANASDADIPENDLTFSLDTAPTGAVIDGETGEISWTPGGSQGSGVYSFTVEVCDDGSPVLCDSESFTVTVAENVPPVIAQGASVSVTMSEDGIPTGFVLPTVTASDSDSDTLTWSLAVGGDPDHGTASVGGVGASPTVTYAPAADYHGPDSFVLQVSDGAGGVATITVNVTVQSVNDAPMITEGGSVAVSLSEDEVATGFGASIHATDVDNDTLTWSLAAEPEHGSASVSGTGASPTITYTPETNYYGSDHFLVQVSDGNNGVDTITVNVTIQPVNDAPVLAEITPRVITRNVELTFTATATDVDDLQSALTFSLTGAPSGASITAGGLFAWTPASDYPTGPTTFTVRVCDDDSPPACDDQLVTVTVEEFELTHAITLAEGWNLVSFSLTPDDTAIEAVFESIEGSYDLVYAWDASGAHAASSGNWLRYDNVAYTPDTLTTLDETMGFWIHMTSADTLTIVSHQPQGPRSITLRDDAGGWNLVGYPSQSNAELPEALTGHGAAGCSLVYQWYRQTGQWRLYDVTNGDLPGQLDEMAPGWGYWVKVGQDSTWSVGY